MAVAAAVTGRIRPCLMYDEIWARDFFLVVDGTTSLDASYATQAAR